MRRPLALGVLVLSLTACGTAATYAPFSAEAEPLRRDVLYASDLVTSHATNAYEAVMQLRPEFFTLRGIAGFEGNRWSGPEVYLDDIALGGPETLRSIPLESVRQIRRLNASEATFRWGTNHGDGVILVVTALR